uniref:Uncharacterized protein n=1 Tax=Arundo donax TaxID=35708 RepID=A0A0A9T011_ARUDO
MSNKMEVQSRSSNKQRILVATGGNKTDSCSPSLRK